MMVTSKKVISVEETVDVNLKYGYTLLMSDRNCSSSFHPKGHTKRTSSIYRGIHPSPQSENAALMQKETIRFKPHQPTTYQGIQNGQIQSTEKSGNTQRTEGISPVTHKKAYTLRLADRRRDQYKKF